MNDSIKTGLGTQCEIWVYAALGLNTEQWQAIVELNDGDSLSFNKIADIIEHDYPDLNKTIKPVEMHTP